MSEVNSMLLDYEEEARQSKSAANEIVEETLRELGYSKRDRNNVRKLFQKQLDWLVRSNGIVTGVHVNKLGTDLTAVATDSLFEQAMSMKVNVLIITDSRTYKVFRYINKDGKKAYLEVDAIDITSITDKDMRVLNAISFENTDVKVLDNIIAEGNLTKEETIAMFNEYIDSKKSDIISFVKEHKPSCSNDDIEKNVNELAQLIGKSMLTPDELRLNYEQAEKKYIDALTSKNEEIHVLSKQIGELSEKNADLQHEVDVLNKKDYKHAVETLEFIAKNSGDKSKRFAGYVNDEIYTSSKLHKFVGEMLQRLYAIKAVEAHAYIFDGEYFRLNSMNAKNNDMVIKNTVYDIMISEDETDDALIRLRAIYSHFPDIVFACMETGFGNTKHNTGINDELLEVNDEYDTCDDELEIISSDVKHEYHTDENIDDTSNSVENAEPVLENNSEIDEVNEQVIEEQSGDDNETPEMTEMPESDEQLSISDLIVKHIVELEYSSSVMFKCMENIDIPNYSLIIRSNDSDVTIVDEDYIPEDVCEEQCSQDETTENCDSDIEEIDDTDDIEELDDKYTDDIEEIDEHEEDTVNTDLVTDTLTDSADAAIEIVSSISDTEAEITDIIGENTDNTNELIDEIDEANEQIVDDIEDIDESNSDESCGNVFNEIISDDNFDNSYENTEDQEYIDDEQEYAENDQNIDDVQTTEDEQAVEPILIVTALSAANSLVSDYIDDIEFNNIEAVTAEEVAFDVNSNYEDLTYDELLVKSLNAVLAIDIYSDLNSKVVTKLKHKRLDELSDFIQVKSADLAEFPSIAGTKYVVCGIENINDLVYTLTRICQAIEIDIDRVYMFMTITTESDIIKDNFGTTFDSIQFRNTENEYKQGEVENTTISLIRGELFNNLLVTGASIKAYADIFKRVLGVKTSYMELNIDGNNYTSLDAISYMIREAEKRNVNIESVKFGTAFGESHKLISFDIDEVGDNPCEIELYSGDIIYCASLNEWQSVVSLIRLHNVLFKNSPIVIKTQVDMDAINFYGSAYDTEIATDSLAICGLAHYVRTHFPQRQG